MLSKILYNLDSLRFNLRGSTSSFGKTLIIESDDWGAIRTPSKNVADKIGSTNKSFHNSAYKNDSLASAADLELLFEVLASKKDKQGRHPILTANFITANPDFQKIKASDFQRYHYEPIDITLSKLPTHSANLSIWKDGITSGIFKPQFHGREHLNVRRWMRALKDNTDETRKYFDLGMTYSGVGDYSFMEAFDWSSREETEEYQNILEEGLSIFRRLFGTNPESFIAPCYNWDDSVETVLAANGVRWMQGIQNQLLPTGKFNEYTRIAHKHGELGANGLRYSVRNVFFEPSLASNKDWVNNALARISNAFLMNKPAVICSHRINYVGFISEKNRDTNLKLLNELLDRILRKWPDVHFASSAEYDKIFGIKEKV